MANLESAEEVIEKLLQSVAWNDLNGLLYWVTRNPGCVDGVGALWSGRPTTPLMVAAAYGRDEAMRHILHWSRADVNRSCCPEGVTALHYAASSGLSNAETVVRLLLNAGANRTLADANGLLPRDAVILSPARASIMHNLKTMLDTEYSPPDMDEYLIMQKYKVLPCGNVREMHHFEREECGKYHVGADDHRRSPWVYGYCSRLCQDYIRGVRACPRGNSCTFAHGAWEAVFHPSHYKTLMCSNGANCNRRLCQFAHSRTELRIVSPHYLTPGQRHWQRHYHVVDSVHPSPSSPSQRSDQTTITINSEDQPPQEPESPASTTNY